MGEKRDDEREREDTPGLKEKNRGDRKGEERERKL